MMGTGPFARPVFRKLCQLDELDIPVLVTRPAVQIKKGKWAENPMKDCAAELGVPVWEPDSINAPEAIGRLREFQADLAVVCDYGQILSAEALSCLRLGGINLHGSLLPRYRGAAPVNWPIYNGDSRTGISVIHMTPKLDGGPVLAAAETEIDAEETAAELEVRLSLLGVEPVLESIEMLRGWDGEATLGQIQDPGQVTSARRLKKSDGVIDWTRSAIELRNQVRAFQPWPGSFTFWHRNSDDGSTTAVRLILHRVDALPGNDTKPPGSVQLAEGTQLIVSTGDGCLSLESVQPSGKRQMATDEFLRGYPVAVGDRFGPETLDTETLDTK